MADLICYVKLSNLDLDAAVKITENSQAVCYHQWCKNFQPQKYFYIILCNLDSYLRLISAR